MLFDFLEGRHDLLLMRAEQVRALQEKPADKPLVIAFDKLRRPGRLAR